MGRSLNSLGGKLLLRLEEHGGIALHDPLGHILVPFPGGVRDHLPAIFLCVKRSLAHGVVVITIDHNHLSTLALDATDAILRGEGMHIDHRRKAHLAGCPCHAGAVVAVGGGGKSGMPQLLARAAFQVEQIAQGHLLVAETSTVEDLFVYGIRSAKHLERVQREPRRFIFYPDSTNPKPLRQVRQALERAHAITGDFTVNAAYLLRQAGWEEFFRQFRFGIFKGVVVFQPLDRDFCHRDLVGDILCPSILSQGKSGYVVAFGDQPCRSEFPTHSHLSGRARTPSNCSSRRENRVGSPLVR